jgi:reversibly glycosylated polypeptide / UDP-arabinopyranose mutase
MPQRDTQSNWTAASPSGERSESLLVAEEHPSAFRVDIVIPTIRDLDFLKRWRPFFSRHHLIIIQDGDPSVQLQVPEGFDYELYRQCDIDQELGENSWIISKGDSARRCFGFLKAKTKYVFSIDDDCYPARDPMGELIDVSERHVHNLETPSFPDYFNTLYDQMFVRGYPTHYYSGRPTAISHGLWLNVPDLAATTQRDYPQLRNDKYVDLSLTVPKKILYPMCGMNFAFNRELIGPAMYFGLMGDGYPWGRYDDMWAGWCSKIICDHLQYGVKTGIPYIWHEKASAWRQNLRKEKKGIEWQEDLVAFFEQVRFSDQAVNAASCYLELADQVEQKLAVLDSSYFPKLAEAMRIWVRLWMKQPSHVIK